MERFWGLIKMKSGRAPFRVKGVRFLSSPPSQNPEKLFFRLRKDSFVNVKHTKKIPVCYY